MAVKRPTAAEKRKAATTARRKASDQRRAAATAKLKAKTISRVKAAKNKTVQQAPVRLASFESVAHMLANIDKLGVKPKTDPKFTHKIRLETFGYSARVNQIRITGRITPQGDNKPAAPWAKVYGSSTYRVVVILGNVQTSESKDKGFIPMPPGKNTPNFVKRSSMTTTPVRVSCSCEYFRHAVAFPNKKHNALDPTVSPIPYTRKTTTRAELNPNNVAAPCKHIVELFRRLRKRGILE